jgi:GH24 family phage-related lysozyme (muramidase)
MFNSIAYLPKLKEFEGAIPSMYLDTGGNVTVGVGNLLASANDAQQFGFVRRAGPGAKPPVTARPATAAEIQTDFDNVSQQTAGRIAGYYRRFTKLDLPDAIITELLSGRVTEFKAKLVAAFPDFDSYPGEACAALFDMGFNLGVAGLTSKFPTLCKAVKDKDWATAAKESHRAPPIDDDRNDWTKAQFEKAAADTKAVPAGLK